MSQLSRLGQIMARSSMLQHQRHMASATTASDPIQRLFLDKIKEFKSTNQGLDDAHKKAMAEEMTRLKRVFDVDEKKLTQLEHKFPSEHHVSLHDIDDSKELRNKIASGEYQKQLMAEEKPKSAIIASIPPQEVHEYHFPPNNHPDESLLTAGAPLPTRLNKEAKADYEWLVEKYTPEVLEKELRVRFGKDMPTIEDDKSPERDLVNFPTYKQALDTPPTRFHLIPESWFRFLHPKTGATGLYTLGFSFTTFLFSKEWLVMEHELLTGFTSATIFAYAVVKFGPKVRQFLRSESDRVDKEWEDWRLGNLSTLQRAQDFYKQQLGGTDVLEALYQIRKADLNNQVELETRTRLQKIHDDTKRRLNYLVAVADSQRQIAHKNIVNWVIKNAVASIGSKQENEVLDSCVSNLKQMSIKNANAI